MTPELHERTNAALRRTVLLRANILGPAVLAMTAGFVICSHWFGIRPGPIAHSINLGLVGVLALVAAWFRWRPVPDPWVHVLSTTVWWGPVAATLVTEYSIHDTNITWLLLVMLASAGVLLDTRYVVGSLVIAISIAIPLVLRDGGSNARLYIAALVAAGAFATLSHILMRRALVTAELHRIDAADTSSQLAARLVELERAKDERAQLHDQLLHSQRLEATGTLAAGLAHDMNNILASITTFAELLLDDNSPTRREDIQRILAQAARGAELTRGLLAFSRRGQYRKQIIRFDTIVQDMVPILSRTLDKAIEIRATTAAGDHCIDGDPSQFAQVLMNLAVNAAAAMDGKGMLAITSDHVVLDAAMADPLELAPGPHVRLRVQDTGIGMDEATRSRIFEPFFTTKPLGSGTGLGLATVWGVVKHHGGSVHVESTLGIGTTFWIYLPIAPAAAKPADEVAAVAVAAPMTPSPSACALPSGPPTVLIVDDEAAVRKGTIRLLERRGFRALEAGDGAEGIRLYRQHAGTIGLVILDMGMPVMGGPECFAQIRALGPVPILIATGYAVEAEAQALVSRGASLIEKPFSSAALYAEVARLLQVSAVQRASE